MDRFINASDDLGLEINRNATILYKKLNSLDVELLGMPERCLAYCKKSHFNRNPLTRSQHFFIHRRSDKIYEKARKEIIDKHTPFWSDDKRKSFVHLTRRKNEIDILKAIDEYNSSGLVPDPTIHGSNTCEPYTGVCVEHLISFSEHKSFISNNHYSGEFLPGFSDTHFQSGFLSTIGKIFNFLICRIKLFGFTFASFIYIVAIPRHVTQN